MKSKSGRRDLNPTDAYRKEQRKKELKKNKKDRRRVRELGSYIKDPEVLKQEIEKMEKLHQKGALDHKLIGKLDQLQLLYPSIMKLHNRKKASLTRGETITEEEMEIILEEAENHLSSVEKKGPGRSSGTDDYKTTPPSAPPAGSSASPAQNLSPQRPGRNPSDTPVQPSQPVHMPQNIPRPPPGLPAYIAPNIPRPPPGLPPGYPRPLEIANAGLLSIPRPPPGPPPPSVLPRPAPPSRTLPIFPNGLQSVPGQGERRSEDGAIESIQGFETLVQSAPLPRPPPPPPYPPDQPPSTLIPPDTISRPQQRQGYVDPLDPSAENYGEYRMMSYVEHTRGPLRQQTARSLHEPIAGPSLQLPAPLPVPMTQSRFRPAVSAELGPVMGPAKPSPVPKELTIFTPPSLRVKRSAATTTGHGPVPVARSGDADGSKGAQSARPAAGSGSRAGAHDAYDEFMSEIGGLL